MKRVTWPDSSRVRQLVPVHRLVYMMDKKLLPSQMPQLDDKGVSLDVGVCTEEHVKCILVNKNYYYYYCLYYCYLPISFYKDFGPSFFVK